MFPFETQRKQLLKDRDLPKNLMLSLTINETTLTIIINFMIEAFTSDAGFSNNFHTSLEAIAAMINPKNEEKIKEAENLNQILSPAQFKTYVVVGMMLSAGRQYPEVIEQNIEATKARTIPFAKKFYELFKKKEKEGAFFQREAIAEISPFIYMRTLLATTNQKEVFEELKKWFEELTSNRNWDMSFEQNLAIESRSFPFAI